MPSPNKYLFKLLGHLPTFRSWFLNIPHDNFATRPDFHGLMAHEEIQLTTHQLRLTSLRCYDLFSHSINIKAKNNHGVKLVSYDILRHDPIVMESNEIPAVII